MKIKRKISQLTYMSVFLYMIIKIRTAGLLMHFLKEALMHFITCMEKRFFCTL